jgi:hypothetical protein
VTGCPRSAPGEGEPGRGVLRAGPRAKLKSEPMFPRKLKIKTKFFFLDIRM